MLSVNEVADMVDRAWDGATEKERQRCLAIVKSLPSTSPSWGRAENDLIDGCNGPELVDVVVDEIVARIAKE